MMVGIKGIAVLIMVLIGINLAILELAKLGIGITCPNLSYESYNQTNETVGWKDIKDLAFGRCEGLPFYLVMLVEVPLFAALLFVANEVRKL